MIKGPNDEVLGGILSYKYCKDPYGPTSVII